MAEETAREVIVIHSEADLPEEDLMSDQAESPAMMARNWVLEQVECGVPQQEAVAAAVSQLQTATEAAELFRLLAQ